MSAQISEFKFNINPSPLKIYEIFPSPFTDCFLTSSFLSLIVWSKVSKRL